MDIQRLWYHVIKTKQIFFTCENIKPELFIHNTDIERNVYVI